MVANEKVVGKEAKLSNTSTFFPMLQSEVSFASLHSDDGRLDGLIYCRGACIMFHCASTVQVPIGINILSDLSFGLQA
ncbi:hypothetical protein Dsin_025677 [Dipteronia sinensis]|uniref:Uncharacterized protein n=1 Tax=Dipteronia sinensis TaxID=43782 RepID=A0AAD9ZWS9_9ROSI|nr:hypothetical protein Dsin_025677 [Dipteronia sinensis]